MAEIRKMEVECKAKCSAEKFFSLITRHAPKIPQYAPKIVRNVQVINKDGEVRVGSIYFWVYVLQGDKPCEQTAKENITAVDHRNMSITFTLIEGDLLKDYSSFSIALTVTPIQRDRNYNCLVKWSLQYQKKNKDIPDPIYFMKTLEDFTKELDTNLIKEK